MRTTAQLVLDRFAIGASVVCALHCAVFPVFLAVFPSLVSLPLDDHLFHQLIVWFVFPSSAAAVLLGCWRHKDRIVLLAGVFGLLALVLTAVFGHELLGEVGEKIATLLAATVLALAHWRNLSLCRRDSCGHSS